MKRPTIGLPIELESALSQGHPWVYRNQLPASAHALDAGWVQISCGAFRAFAFYDPDSQLALRIFSRKKQPDAPWLAQQVARAWQRRQQIRDRGDTDTYRVIHGEGDGLPGIVSDLYGAYLMLRLDTPALELLVDPLVAGLKALPKIKGILIRRAKGTLDILSGRAPGDNLVVSESGLRFSVAVKQAQKTGLFLDHRENRRTLETHSSGCEVLNLFSYTGAFSLYAARGGASAPITSVDQSSGANAAARENFRINGLNAEDHEFISGDAFAELERLAREQRSFDIVISDPPSFARNKSQRHRALRAYERLHRLAMAVLRPGGLYAAASCTSQVDPPAFRTTLASAAARSGRQARLIHEAGHALDHPILAGHPEGRYLKFMLLRVEPTA